MTEQNEEQAIEEMAECLIYIQQDFNEYCAKPCRECEMGGIVNCENHYKAGRLYNAGYRKQKWISVYERLPEKDGRYLVAMKNGNDYHISTRKFRRAAPPSWWKGHTYGHWARYTGGVRYWMPLPEPPKMKGGAEQ